MILDLKSPERRISTDYMQKKSPETLDMNECDYFFDTNSCG